jgi:Dehydratase family
MPGCAIAAVRHNRPTVIVYGGTIQVGERHVDCPAMGYKKGDPVNISDAFESYGESRLLVIVIFGALTDADGWIRRRIYCW